MIQLKNGDVCRIVDVHKKDHYFEKKEFLIGKKVRIICSISQMLSKDDGLFNGWVEITDGAPQIKIGKEGFANFTHAILEKIE